MEEGQDAMKASVRLERENVHEQAAKDLHGGKKVFSCTRKSSIAQRSRVQFFWGYWECALLLLGYLKICRRSAWHRGISLQARELVEQYGEKKAKSLMKRCEASGAWKWDLNFPADESERLFVVYTGWQAEESSIARDTKKLVAQKDHGACLQPNPPGSTQLSLENP